jgi:chitodextrinase
MKRSLSALTLAVAVWLVLSVSGFARAHAQVVGVTSPSVPSGVTAVAGPVPGQVTVSWSASTETSGTIAGYYVYRNGGALASTAGTSFTDTGGATGLISGVFGYSIAAYDANGNVSPQSGAFSVVVTANTTPPSVPTGVTISGVTTTNPYTAPTTTLTISWNASTDKVGVTGYNVYRNSTMITSSTSAFTGTSITDSVTPGSYSYTVNAYDAAGNISAHSAPAAVTVFADYLAPSTPKGLVVQQTGVNTLVLTWASSTDGYGVSGYQVFRNGVWITSTTAPSYQDTGVSTGTSYSYMVTAYDVAGNISPQSPSVNVYVQQTNGPTTPVIANDMLVGTSSAQLSWSIPYDPIAISGYTLYRDGVLLATVTSTNYLDARLAPGLHGYNVAATDMSGATSSMSATSTIIVPSLVATAAATQSTATVIPPAALSATGASPAPTGSMFTQSLYYGLRTAQVTTLQAFLVANGYMSSTYATGFFGNITLKALETFQCDHAVACNGGAGWGIVGPKTRAALNALEQGTAGAATSSAAQLTELQALEAELASLQKQLPVGTR